MKFTGSSRGFTLVEMLIAAAGSIVLLVSLVSMMRSAADISDIVGQRAEMQQNVRVALNLIATDLRQAGAGMPRGGIALPAGNGIAPGRRGCDSGSCYFSDNDYPNSRLYSVTPGNGIGTYVDGHLTDCVTLVYRDPALDLDEFQLASIADDGTAIGFNPQTDMGDGATEIRSGDILVLTNVFGSASGVVTAVNGLTVSFNENDPLAFNQPDAPFGNIARLSDEDGVYPPTIAYRVTVVSYFIDATDWENPILMRQVSAHPPTAVAEHIMDLQFTFDIFDDEAEVAVADLGDAGGLPNQIRKMNIHVSSRSPKKTIFRGQKQYVSLRTSVSGRNLAFRDRYE